MTKQAKAAARIAQSQKEDSPKDYGLYKTLFKKLGEEKSSKKFENIMNNYNYIKKVADLKKKSSIFNFESRLNSKLFSGSHNHDIVNDGDVNDNETMSFKDLLTKRFYN